MAADFFCRDASQRRQRLVLAERLRANLPALLQVRSCSSHSLVTRDSSHVTRHTSHVTRHTSHPTPHRIALLHLRNWMQHLMVNQLAPRSPTPPSNPNLELTCRRSPCCSHGTRSTAPRKSPSQSPRACSLVMILRSPTQTYSPASKRLPLSISRHRQGESCSRLSRDLAQRIIAHACSLQLAICHIN